MGLRDGGEREREGEVRDGVEGRRGEREREGEVRGGVEGWRRERERGDGTKEVSDPVMCYTVSWSRGQPYQDPSHWAWL